MKLALAVTIILTMSTIGNVIFLKRRVPIRMLPNQQRLPKSKRDDNNTDELWADYPYPKSPFLLKRLHKAVECMKRDVNASDTYTRCFQIPKSLLVSSHSILTAHALALIEKNKNKLGTSFEGVSSDVWVFILIRNHKICFIQSFWKSEVPLYHGSWQVQKQMERKGKGSAKRWGKTGHGGGSVQRRRGL